MINIKDLTFGYRLSSQKVFDHFSLELQGNSIYGLLGKNSTGKSTLLNLISGMLRPQSGTIEIDGLPSDERSKALLERLYLVPEELALPNYSFKKFVEIYSPFYKDFSQEMLDFCLQEFGLPYKMKLATLSMGNKKKAMTSFALAANTRILLLDEPTNGLDIPSRRQFRRVIAQCMHEDRTIIISTHQVQDIEALLDHITIIGNKQLLLNASTEQLTTDYYFGPNPTGEILYTEKSLEGDRYIARRTDLDEETSVNVEMLFEYVNNKQL